MHRLPATLLLALLAGTTVGSAAAAEIYRWKDAKGVVHFSQTPPKGVANAKKVENVFTAPRPAATTTTATTTAPAATATTASAGAGADNPACVRARENLAVLDGQNSVQMDTDGDGKPDKTLSNAERKAQRDVAEASIKANCTAS